MALYLCLFILPLALAEPVPLPGELRIPRVYNALITSGENLTPSRAVPVFQPVIQETAYGYPLHHHLIYHDALRAELQSAADFQNLVAESKTDEQQPISSPNSKTNDGETKPQQQSQRQIDPNNPPGPNIPPQLKLNEFGLPPSLIPIQPYSARNPLPYDPYNPYLPYNPYNPYHQPFPYNPYLYQSPYYNIPPTALQPQLPPLFPPTGFPFPSGPPSPEPPPPSQSPQTPQTPQSVTEPEQPNPGTEESPSSDSPNPIPGDSPPDLNIKNNSNKNPDIPDVPPPPLPRGGLKYDNKEKRSS